MYLTDVTCPHCPSDSQLISDYGSRKYPGHPICERHGCVLVGEEWVFECSHCGARVEKLHGLFVPHLCKPCLDKTVAEQQASGAVCGMCRKVYALCCC